MLLHLLLGARKKQILTSGGLIFSEFLMTLISTVLCIRCLLLNMQSNTQLNTISSFSNDMM